MIFETKFNVGDDFWVMTNNKPTKFTLDAVYISIKSRGVHISYEAKHKSYDRDAFTFNSYDCYASKEELIKSL